jgi:antitoxin component of MazEF toxin-antitoxin module
MTITIKRIGGSMAVVIPKSLAQEMHLTDGQTLDITTSAGALVMKSSARRPRRSLASIVSQIKPATYRRRSHEMPDRPVGKEIW